MKVLKSVFFGISLFAAFYLFGAFFNVSFDLNSWGEYSRLTVACVGGIISLFGACLYYNPDQFDCE